MPPQVHLLDINGPAHIFYEAQAFGAPLQTYFISVQAKTEVESSAGLFFSQLTPFSEFDLSKEDFIFVPGLDYGLLSSLDFLEKCQDFFQWLREQAARGVNICSVCTGAFLLAESGILNGKSCTTHWKYFKEFAAKFPQVGLEKNRLFVFAKNLYSSAGVSSGIDLALYLLERLYGAKFALDIAKEVVIYLRRGEEDPQLSIFLQYRNHLDDRIHEIQDLISQDISQKWLLADLAECIHTSPRNLTRLFKKTTGITIGQYIEQIRLEQAQQLRAEGHKMDYIAQTCGFKSTNQLRHLLQK